MKNYEQFPSALAVSIQGPIPGAMEILFKIGGPAAILMLIVQIIIEGSK
tara:strand:- start:215 stop:361 length:147 start_codon:yes stop_codon:yes gene_type:complete